MRSTASKCDIAIRQDSAARGPASDWKRGSTDCASTANPHVCLSDLDGRVSQIAGGSGVPASRFTYDTTARLASIESLTALNGTVDATKSFTYGYADPFDRLTSQTPATGNAAQTLGYGYDAIGNRRTLTTSSAPPGLVNDNLTITIGADNRPTQFNSSLTGITQLKINALGQRVKKDSATTGVTRFVYDEAGRLIGEYDNAGNPILEHVWLNDLPLAVIRSGGILYVHTDQLGTPRVLTTITGFVVWKWDNVDPFGNNLPNEMVSGGNVPFRYNLRFPGQYYDSETNTNYNYFRDYDSATGRYIQSDAIGIDGGINTYLYANGSPLMFLDDDGLNPIAAAIAAATVALREAVKKCGQNKTCRCNAIHLTYSVICRLPRCEGATSCSDAIIREIGARACVQFRKTFLAMGCSKNPATETAQRQELANRERGLATCALVRQSLCLGCP